MSKVKVKSINGEEDQIIEFEDDMTVFNLKERINDRLNISIDNQRLIYCGRILDNDKKLKDYDLNNKVIHLVNSPPRLDRNEAQNNNQSDSSDSEPQIGTSHYSINFNFNGTGVHSNAESRYNNLQRILGYINLAIDKLDRDPNLSSPTNEQNFTENGATTSSTNNSNNASANVNSIPQEGLAAIENLLSPEALLGLPNSITQVSVIAVDANGNQQQQGGQNIFNSLGLDVNDLISGVNGSGQGTSNIIIGGNISSNNSNNSTNNTTTSSNNTNQQSRLSSSNSNSLNSLLSGLTQNIMSNFTTSNTSSSNNNPNRNQQSSSNISSIFNQTSANISSIFNNNSGNDQNRSNNSNQANNSTTTTTTTNQPRRITWQEYANVLDNVRITQERFNPHFRKFQQSLLQPFGSLNDQQAEEMQTRFRMTARVMHHLAHVYHMLSDFYINYVHQQDQTVQIYNPIAPSPLHMPTSEFRVNLGSNTNSGSNTNLNDLFNVNSNSNSRTATNESLNNPTSSSRARRDLSDIIIGGGVASNLSSASSNSNTSATLTQRDSSTTNAQNRPFNILPNNLQNSNSSVNIIRPSTIVIQTVAAARNLNQTTNNNTNNTSRNQQQSSSQRTLPFGLSNLFDFGSSGSSRQQQQASSNSQNNNNTTTNSSSNVSAGLRGITNQRLRPNRNIFNPGFPYQSHALSFDPHLRCTSTYLIPEFSARLEVDYTSMESFRPATSNTIATSNSNSNTSTTQSSNQNRSRTIEPNEITIENTTDLESLELFNDLRMLFSDYLERDELLRRIDNLPNRANSSLSSFIDSMNILNLVSRGKSNITLELFLILAQKISVIEFLKIIFMQDNDSSLRCLNRAQESMINYARTNLLFNNQEPFDTSQCVDDLLKIWKKVLSTSFNELKSDFSERTFSALISELRANLSVFLRTFTRTFSDDNSENCFASSLYLAIQRLMVDFHTSLSQMFRSPKNLMRAYKNLLTQIFPNPSVRSIIIGILCYRIPAIDEHEKTILDRNRFSNRLNDLSSDTQSSNNNLLNQPLNRQTSNQYSSTSDVSNYSTPMEIDLDIDYDLNYGSENWHLNCPKNWIKILTIDLNKQNAINTRQRLRFSSIYKEAYEKN